MSDEFIALATKEINEELIGIENILNTCKNNDDVFEKSSELQRHTHKIKGLAPMMNKEELGELSSQLDTMLKKIIDGVQIPQVYDLLVESLPKMKSSMTEANSDLNSITNKIKQLLSNL